MEGTGPRPPAFIGLLGKIFAARQSREPSSFSPGSRTKLRSGARGRPVPNGQGDPGAGLESVKKTHQVAGVGKGSGAPSHFPSTAIRGTEPTTMSLTMAQGIKRLGMPIAALLGLVLVALLATSWLINRDALRQAV